MSTTPFTLTDFKNAYADGATVTEVLTAIYRRIQDIGDPGIFIHLRSLDDVIADAAELGNFDPEKPLWGVPFAVKDNIDVAGVPTTAACPAFAYTPDKDAFVIAQLRQAGAIPIGKTNLDQFATGLVGVRSPYPIPKNAIDPDIVPGGSSAGSATAVAHGIVPFALGTDTAGSGRVPAALQNIVGLKPTLGAISNSGVVPACRTLDTVSVFALTVEDAYTAYEAAAGYDADEAWSKPMPVASFGASASGFRIGVPTDASREFFGDAVQAASFASAIERLEADGHVIDELDFEPFYAVARMLYEGAWVAERFAAIEDLVTTNPDALHPTTRVIIEPAGKLTASQTFNGMYRLAELKRAVEPLLAEIDLLCVPTIPTFYSVVDLEADPIGPNSRFGTYTNFVNLMDMCGIAVPVAARTDGRPGSVTLLAKAGLDHRVASLAADLERVDGRRLGATPAMLPPQRTVTTEAAPNELAIAVCGAHMSGLPLNHQLTDRGGRFLKATTSAPSYSLHALAGGPPLRPGMVRCDEGGAKIDLEVWALPKSEVGSFLAGIPAPLGLGQVELEDGSSVTGFICETAGLQGATDITKFGGWRAFLASKAR